MNIMTLKKTLAGIVLLLSAVGASPQEPTTARGLFLVAPKQFELQSFAHVQMYTAQDTIHLYAGPTGLTAYAIPVNVENNQSEKEYTVFVQPGFVDPQSKKIPGDQFTPYHSTIQLKPGQNDLQELVDYSLGQKTEK